MMLVYHFKGRISILEQKCDTMFDIMNNMVKEMKNIKYVFGMAFNQNHPVGERPFSSHLDSIYEEQDEDEDEDEDKQDDNDESEPLEYEEINMEPYLEKIVVSDNEDEAEEPSVKVINIDFNQEMDINGLTDINDEIEVVEDLDEEEVDIDIDMGIEVEVNVEDPELVVNKLDITIDPANENGEYLAKNEPMDYKKIDVSYLRTLAITRGLVSDTKRLKKQDLVRLLEQSNETE